MPHLRSVAPQIVLDGPSPEVRAAIRAWKAGSATAEQQQEAYRYVVYWLAGVVRSDFAMPGEESVVNWRQGCRFVGLQIEAAAEVVIGEPEPPPPPPAQEPMAQKARRRAKKA